MKTSIVVYFVFAFSSFVHADEQMVQVAKRYEAKGALDVAAELLQDNLNEGDALDTMPHLIAFVERNIDKLERKNTHGCASIFQQPHMERGWVSVGRVISIVLNGGQVPIVGHVVGEAVDKAITNDEEKKQAREMESTAVPPKEEVKEVLAAYDVLRGAVICMEQRVKAEMRGAIEDEQAQDAWLENRRKVKMLKERLKASRTSYLSFMVVSPRFWEVERALYLADNLTGADESKLEEAVTYLSHAAHKVWLQECDESVRKQLRNIKLHIKEISSEAVRKDLETLSTLLDSDDPSKKMGADAWMP